MTPVFEGVKRQRASAMSTVSTAEETLGRAAGGEKK